MTTNNLINEYGKELLPTYDRFSLALESGKGATLKDVEGRKYIDFSSGLGVNAIGYGNDKWVSAITEQAKKLQHTSNLFYTAPGLELAKRLNAATGMAGAFFSNSGSEANEGVIKLARKYSFDKYGAGRDKIVTLKNSFHGRTIATLEATGQEKFHNYFFPFTGGFNYSDMNMDSIRDNIGNDVCAVLIELIQGEGGVYPLDKSFVKSLREFCSEKDILLLIDEVQTGIGRTGTLFAFQQYGILPDAVSFAKGIAGGLPMGGFLAAAPYRAVLGLGTHASTFGANPVCCSAALAVLDILDDKTLSDVTAKGEYIKAAVQNIGSPYTKNTRGLGLMLGIQIKDISHLALVKKLISNGLVCLTAGSDTVRFLPPLTISYEELDAGLDIFKNTINNV
ncbi:MAG: acetylornithine/succinylornithine family transaminase [Clostridiales bacterium]|jgi:acetylornithine/N-succinyldiaminopimelate aminotransferase|nr:acetylornithine/succinylornithine family transaminase [Clostridiales bacterium]